MPFVTKFDAIHEPGTPNWVLDSDLIYQTADDRLLIAPKGMATDLYSIPGLLRGFLFRSQSYVEAAVMHDAAYRGELLREIQVLAQKDPAQVFSTRRLKASLSRQDADRLLRDIMKESKAPATLIQSIYWGVRAGGWASYKS